ncbi:MAG TPA: two-component system response regulator [Cytophagales bacterium]|nr:two-component system response regulator [Cytophagales bacterium]
MKNKILFVDDSKTILALVSGLFGSNYQLVCKQDAKEALNAIKQDFIPDLIITDLNMPDMNGYEFVRKLKSDQNLEKIPIIVLSGIGESAERLKLYKMGVDEYLLKPFNPEELLVRVEKILNRHSQLKLEFAEA